MSENTYRNNHNITENLSNLSKIGKLFVGIGFVLMIVSAVSLVTGTNAQSVGMGWIGAGVGFIWGIVGLRV